MEDCYRIAAAMLLLRPVGDGVFDILLLHKPRKKDAWQLPQGGMEEGETIEQCAVRELNEEAGLSGVTVFGKSEHVYQYDFPASYRRFRPDHICGQRIEFVFATTGPDSEVQVDGKEVDRHLWIRHEQFPKYLKRKEYLTLVQNLYQEAMEKLV